MLLYNELANLEIEDIRLYGVMEFAKLSKRLRFTRELRTLPFLPDTLQYFEHNGGKRDEQSDNSDDSLR